MKKLMVCAALLALCGGTYAKDADGTWRDPKTGLVWMRCTVGQTWDGAGHCSGKATEFIWREAENYLTLFNKQGYAGKKDWRLPEINELVTLRRCSKGWAHAIESAGDSSKDMGVEKVELPNGQQVPSLCADGSRKPTLDAKVFPDTHDTLDSELPFWTNSGDKNDADGFFVWYVDFNSGSASTYGQDRSLYVRLVRSSK